MSDSGASESSASPWDALIGEVERENVRLRAQADDVERERAAIVRERLAIDVERGDWHVARADFDRERASWADAERKHLARIGELERRLGEAAAEAAAATERETTLAAEVRAGAQAEAARHAAALEECAEQMEAVRAERDALRAALLRSQVYDVRHRLGVLAHKLPAVRRRLQNGS